MPAPPPTPPESTLDPHAMFCRTCRRALTVRLRTDTGTVTYLHPVKLRGGAADHLADPAPLTEIDEPIMECDFCSAPEPVWAYACADQCTEYRAITSRTVGAQDYHNRHGAARTRRVETAKAPTHAWGQRWTACAGCAELIEARDLYGLISQVTDSLPAKYTRGKWLVRTRAQLHATYSTVLDTLAPGRDRITRTHP